MPRRSKRLAGSSKPRRKNRQNKEQNNKQVQTIASNKRQIATSETHTGMTGGSSTGGIVGGTMTFNEPVIIHNANQGDTDVSASVDLPEDGSTALVKLSVPAKDGPTSVNLFCEDGEIKQYYYRQGDDLEHKLRSRLNFRNVPKDVSVSVMVKSGKEFAKLVDEIETHFSCKLCRVYDGCLVLEFLHDSEENAEAMMNDQDTVKRLFAKFMKDSGKDYPESSTLEVSLIKPVPASQTQTRREESELPSTSKQSGLRTHQSKTEEKTSSPKRGKRVSMESIIKGKKSFLDSPTTSMPDITDEPRVKRKKIEDKKSECGECGKILHRFQISSIPGNGIFIIHLSSETINDPELMNNQENPFDFFTVLSSFRNADGGTLLVHLDCQRALIEEGFMTFIDKMCDKVIALGEDACEVLKVEEDEQSDDVYILRLAASEKVITVDFKTKIPGPTKNFRKVTTPQQLMSYLSSKRSVGDKKPILKGIGATKDEENIVKLYYEQPSPDAPRSEHHIVEDIMEKVLLAEHVTSCSKRKQGGSIFVGHRMNVQSDSMQRGLDMTGLKIGHDREQKFRFILQSALTERLLLYNNPHSDTKLQAKDVFEIEAHFLGEGFIVEVAVRGVNGCVFYDPEGPEAYKLEEGFIQRISFDNWIEKVIKD